MSYFISDGTPTYVVSFEPSTGNLYVDYRREGSFEEQLKDVQEGIEGLQLLGGKLIKVRINTPHVPRLAVYRVLREVLAEIYQVVAVLDMGENRVREEYGLPPMPAKLTDKYIVSYTKDLEYPEGLPLE